MLKFKDCNYDAKKFLGETKVGHIISDSTVYTNFKDFDENVFRKVFTDRWEMPLDKEFAHIGKIDDFKSLLDAGQSALKEVEIDDGDSIEDIACKEIFFRNHSSLYIQLIKLSDQYIDIIKTYLIDYNWRFDIVSFFEYQGVTYLYLLCDAEN